MKCFLQYMNNEFNLLKRDLGEWWRREAETRGDKTVSPFHRFLLPPALCFLVFLPYIASFSFTVNPIFLRGFSGGSINDRIASKTTWLLRGRAVLAVPCSRMVYARHGRDLMGCLARLGREVPCMWTLLISFCFININTSRRQGRFREGGSEGSRSANPWADGQKQHTRPSFRVSQHNMTKPRVREIG